MRDERRGTRDKGRGTKDEKSVVTEALRRFLETHKPELMEKFIKEDVAWGLRGND